MSGVDDPNSKLSPVSNSNGVNSNLKIPWEGDFVYVFQTPTE